MFVMFVMMIGMIVIRVIFLVEGESELNPKRSIASGLCSTQKIPNPTSPIIGGCKHHTVVDTNSSSTGIIIAKTTIIKLMYTDFSLSILAKCSIISLDDW